jgi:peptide/nickel transport system substrate-binding protein
MMVPPEILDMDLASTKPVGSGPYRLKTWTTGADYVWERNPTSRFAKDGLPYTDEREYITIGDPSALEASFSSGQLHAIEMTTPDQRDRLKKNLGDKMYVITYLALNPFTFNIMGQESLNQLKQDDRVRQAAYKTINRQQFLDLLFKGEGVVPPGILQPPQADYQIDWNDKTPNGMTVTDIWKQDLQAAKQLISAAGVGNQEWELDVITDTTGLDEQSGQILQTQFAQVGLKLKVVPLPGAQLLPKAHDGNVFLFTGGHPAYDSPQTPMRQQATDSHNEFGWTGLEDPEVDALVAKSEVATNRDENISLVKQLQLLCLSKWGGYIQLLTHNTDLLLRSEVQNWEYDAAQTVIYMANTWLNA